jgi:hypothetical protein
MEREIAPFSFEPGAFPRFSPVVNRWSTAFSTNIQGVLRVIHNLSPVSVEKSSLFREQTGHL